MTQAKQKELVESLVNNVQARIFNQIENGKIPSGWDGHELRALLEYNFAECATMSLIKQYPRQKRAKDFRNIIIVNNL